MQVRPDIATGTSDHLVHFSECTDDLVRAVGAHILTGLLAGDPALIIATPEHITAVEQHLAAAGVDVAAARARGELLLVDARATLDAFLRDGRIDPAAFDDRVGGLVRSMAGDGRPVRAYGEMVALLWEDGDVLGAIELETLWNDLGSEVRFSLLCGYPSSITADPERADAARRVCALHTDVRRGAAAEVTQRFAADLEGPRAARRLVVDTLRRWGVEGVVDDAAVVVSELATNALLHARSAFAVTVRTDGPSVRIAVVDDSTVTPAPSDEPGLAPSGRGLTLVDALAHRWGVDGLPDGKAVWAELRP